MWNSVLFSIPQCIHWFQWFSTDHNMWGRVKTTWADPTLSSSFQFSWTSWQLQLALNALRNVRSLQMLIAPDLDALHQTDSCWSQGRLAQGHQWQSSSDTKNPCHQWDHSEKWHRPEASFFLWIFLCANLGRNDVSLLWNDCLSHGVLQIW